MAKGPVHEPFHTLARQQEADRLGMILFLASEIMLFSGIFAAAMVLRVSQPKDYVHASAGLNLWLGTANTVILLTSSLCAALTVEMARTGRRRLCGIALAGALLLGGAFLGVKALEYAADYRDGLMPGTARAHFETHGAQLFMNLYFTATGLHGVHVVAGMGLLLYAALARSGEERADVILTGNAALFWHLVDVIWLFLYPTLYLPGAGGG
jgi:cytochrome c oxidase subunit 3